MSINMIDYQLALALTMSAFIGAISGYLGSIMIIKRMALVGGALGHLTMPGIALAMLYDFDVSVGAFTFLLFGIFIIWLLEQKTHLPIESLTAVVFAASVGVTFLFLPEEKTIPALIGNISNLSGQIVLITIILALTLFYTIKKILPGLILMGISQDIAHSTGINVKKYNLIYLLSIALVVALGVRIMGGLLTAAIMSIPACSSRNISLSLFQYSYGSLLIGSFSCIVGTFLYRQTGLPVGPATIIIGSLLFLISLFIRVLLAKKPLY